jgi:hypothetical protein
VPPNFITTIFIANFRRGACSAPQSISCHPGVGCELTNDH